MDPISRLLLAESQKVTPTSTLELPSRETDDAGTVLRGGTGRFVATGTPLVDGFPYELPVVSPVRIEVLDPHQQVREVELEDLRRADISRLAPIRYSTPYPGQRNVMGRYFSVSMGQHLFAESRLEQRWLLYWDFCRDVVAYATQPFSVTYADADNALCTHTPDALLELSDSSVRLVNIKPADRIHDDRLARDLAACFWVAQRCGWTVVLLNDVHPVMARNLRWLRNFARPVWDPNDVADVLLERVEASPLRIDALLGPIEDPMALPVLFSLIWNGDLAVDLTETIDVDTVVALGDWER